jgi:hypothetical protein
MHYDFKQKLNKIDSQQFRNLRIPEIDWKLNEAQELFVKMVAKPRLRNSLGFETSQRSIDDIRTVVVKGYCSDIINNTMTLPTNYWHFLKGQSIMDKGNCKAYRATLKIRQHDDEFEKSPFDCSSFEWREVNAVFYQSGLKFHDDGTFENKIGCIDYIKKLDYIHNAEDFRAGGYELPSGVALTGTRDCILPDHTHREIVDIAVLIATGDLQNPDYDIKQAKVNLNLKT